MKEPQKFPCDKCGECCRHIGGIAELADFDRGNGTCVNLAGNICRIYGDRPLICRVDEMYERCFADEYSREEFYKLNLAVCQRLRESRAK